MKKSLLIFLITAFIFIIAWYFVSTYTNIFAGKNNLYYGYYDNIEGLQGSSPVYLKGVKVGKVDEITLNDEHKIKITFEIKKEVRLPQGTVANIGSGDLSGNKSVILIPGNGKTFLKNGGTLLSGIDSSMIEQFNAKVSPILHNGKVLLNSADTALQNFNELVINGLGRETQMDIARFTTNMEKLSHTSGKANQRIQKLQQTITKLDSTTNNPEQKNKNINKSIIKTNKATADIARGNMDKDVQEMKASINKLSQSFDKFNQNKMLNDKQPYQDANHAIDSFNKAMMDYQNDPPSLIRIFSGKKKK